ncbi:MAG: hypothetical protein KDI46_03595 [Alphaproteobacteria bacterium]|nr:hypothetical protein [Alphaproteobacteria bacterium]
MRESYLEKQTRRHARTSMGGLLRTAFRQQQESDTWPLQQAISQGHDSVLKWLLHYDRECADCPAQHVLKTLKNAGYKTTEKKSFNWGDSDVFGRNLVARAMQQIDAGHPLDDKLREAIFYYDMRLRDERSCTSYEEALRLNASSSHRHLDS